MSWKVTFSLSTLQFSFSLVMTRDKKITNYEQLSFHSKLAIVLFNTEIWGLLFKFFFQDFLFLIIRTKIIAHCETSTKNNTLYFFVIKNFFISVLELQNIFYTYTEAMREMREVKVSDESWMYASRCCLFFFGFL